MSERRIQSPRLIWVEAFLEVASLESFTAGAHSMGVNQSTATRYVDQLERWLRKPLFTGDIPPRLTEEGEKFVEIARSVLMQMLDFRAPLPKRRGAPAAPISGKDIDMSFWTRQPDAGKGPAINDAE